MSAPPPEDKPTEESRSLVREMIALLRRHAEQERRVSLIVHHRDGAESVALQFGVPVVVGRRAPASLVVPGAKLSRSHARFTLDTSGRVLVEDLGSTNGTWIAGTRIDRAAVELGEQVVLGEVIATVQITTPEKPVVSAASGGAGAPIAASAAMRTVLEMAARVAASAVPVILHGETGTGKEVVARFVHESSPRAARPMVSVNCAAIPAQLVESTLFGYEKGAFTGAAQRQKGVFEEADGGTVFLDEIGELPLAAQAALLRVLETGRFSRVGSPREVSVDVRIVAATHRDLEALRDAGQFRADLYYRLGVMVIHVPPLRDRLDDLEPLVRRFMGEAGPRLTGLTPAALETLRTYAWPGNVRELRNAIERAAILAAGPTLATDDLPTRVRSAAAPRPPPREHVQTIPPTDTDASGLGDLRARLTEYEANTIRDMLVQTNWNQSEAARRLGMPIRTLSHKAKVMGLKKP
jgi:DNA-binding NtrC family response regulator